MKMGESPRAVDKKLQVNNYLDLLPILVFNKDGQELLKQLKINILEEEKKWNEEYWLEEFEANQKLIPNERHVLKLYEIPTVFDPKGLNTDSYPHYLVAAQTAKYNIGPATIDIWAIKGIFQWYRAYYEKYNGWYVDEFGEKIQKLNYSLSDYEMQLFSFIYTRIVQEQVVEGIKHTSGGSAAFEMYFLNNLTDPKTVKIVQRELESPAYGLTKLQVGKLLGIVSFAKENNNFLKAMKNFISKYNKGTLPKDDTALLYWEKYISDVTFFGGLVKPLFDIDKHINSLKEKTVKPLDEIDPLLLDLFNPVESVSNSQNKVESELNSTLFNSDFNF